LPYLAEINYDSSLGAKQIIIEFQEKKIKTRLYQQGRKELP
jgi:hypothetical protein